MFPEGKSPVELAVALDEPGDRVRAMYREYRELTGRYELVQIYDKAKHCLPNLLRLHKIARDLRMNEHDIKKVFELAKYNQWKIIAFLHSDGISKHPQASARRLLLLSSYWIQ